VSAYWFKKTIICVEIRRIHCKECGSSAREPLEFCTAKNVGYTKWLAKFVLALRAEMSIHAVAQFTGLHWQSVKNIEKTYWAHKYSRPSLRAVKRLGIDEVYLGRKLGFISVVRNLENGAVLFVGKRKGGAALEPFKSRIRRRAKQIQAVAIDMSNAYAAWIEQVLPNAEVVYDPFHVIKLMNARMDALRRTTMNKLEEEQKKALKGKRFLLLKNYESLKDSAKEELQRLRLEYQDLGTASLMKKYLRNSYRLADGVATARKAFTQWCEKAEVSAVKCLTQMAKTIRKRMEGLLAFWKYDRMTKASQEGFNNKIGWLTRQAYGYRDEDYLHLNLKRKMETCEIS
jgi:transposase